MLKMRASPPIGRVSEDHPPDDKADRKLGSPRDSRGRPEPLNGQSRHAFRLERGDRINFRKVVGHLPFRPIGLLQRCTPMAPPLGSGSCPAVAVSGMSASLSLLADAT